MVPESAKRIGSHIDRRPRLDEAIRHVLREVPPDAPVTIVGA